MKTCLVLIFVFASQFNVLAQKYNNYEKQGKDQVLIYNNRNIEKNLEKYEYINSDKNLYEAEKLFLNRKRYDEDYDDDDLGNPDKRAIIVRPCAFFDRFCIRKFFAEHSKCKIVPGPVREPIFVEQNELNLSNNNITATALNSEVTGINNGRIDEFFINKVTGNLVLSVYFEGVKFLSDAYFRFNRNGQEPVETRAFAAIDYLKFTVTIVIPNYNNLRLEDAEVNGYLDDPFPPFVVGPGAVESADPTPAEELASLLADIPTAVIENLPTVAPLVAKIFVQRSICEFGVPINKL